MKLLVPIVLVLFALFTTATAKKFTKCEFAKEMTAAGISKSKIPTWACIAHYESSYNSAAKGGTNKSYYGIFQIGSKYWCDQSNKKGCNIKCSSK